jgi:hypothetical protein
MGSRVLTLAVNDRPDGDRRRATPSIQELDRVQTPAAAPGEEGEDKPAGSTGTTASSLSSP